MAQDTQTGIAGYQANRGRQAKRSHAASERLRRTVLLALLTIVCVACVVVAWPIKSTITRGLWLKGGTATTMKAAGADGADVDSADLSKAASVIGKRLDAVGVSEYQVSPEGEDQLVIKLPNGMDGEAVATAVGGAGKLEFVRIDEIGDADALAKINAGTSGVQLKEGTYTAFMGPESVKSASVTEVATGVYAVTLEFTDEGKTTFADVTRELAEETGSIALVVDGRVLTAPSVSEEIGDGQVSITGDFDELEANAIKAVVDSEVLPITLSEVSSEKIGPLIGKGTLWVLVGLACAAFVCAAVFAYIKLGKLGSLVAGEIAVYTLVLLGLMAVFSRADMLVLTLVGAVTGAAVALVAGFATWRIVSRFKALVAEGMSVRGAGVACVPQALQPFAVPAVAVFVVACVLMFVPLMSLRGFAALYILGFLAALAGVFWYAVTLLRLWASGPIQDNPEAWGIAKPAMGKDTK